MPPHQGQSRQKFPPKQRAKWRQSSGANAKVKSKTLMVFTRQLATLIDSGLPLASWSHRSRPPGAVPDHEAHDHHPGGKRADRQHLLGKSLQQFPRIFNKLYVNMVKAGELGGVLEIVLNRLAEYQEKAQKLKNKIVAAMVYPIIVMVIAVLIMVFLMLVIVPKFEKIFEDMLPAAAPSCRWLTQVVIGFSRTGWEPTWHILGSGPLIFIVWKIFQASPKADDHHRRA
jgi:type IV pilus assembly protein PilC